MSANIRWVIFGLSACAVACGGSGSGGSANNGPDGSAAYGGSGAKSGTGGFGATGGTASGGQGGVGGSAGASSGGSAGLGGSGGTSGEGGSAGSGGTGGGGNLGAATWVYYKEWSGGFYLVDAALAIPQPIEIPGASSIYNHPRFSPDGTQFAMNAGGGIDVTVWSLAGAQPALTHTLTGLSGKETFLYPPYKVNDGPWLPGDRLLYYAYETSGAGQLRIVDVATNQLTTIGDESAFAYDLSPDNKWIAWRNTDPVRVASLAAPSAAKDIGSYDLYSWSGDSTRLAVMKLATKKLDVYDVSTGTPVLAWSAAGQPSSGFVWSTVGSRLAYTSTVTPGSGIYLVDFANPTPAAKKLVDGDSLLNGSLSFKWSESGKLLVATRGYVDKLFDAQTGNDVTPAATALAQGSDFRVSPDDKWLFWTDTATKLTNLASPGSAAISVAGEIGTFAKDSKAFVNDVTTAGATQLTYEYSDLSTGVPKKIGSFNTPDKNVFLRSVGDVRYIFWIDNLSGQYSHLFTLPIVNGTLLAPKQLSGPNDFVYNGFNCLDCKAIGD